MSSTYTFTDCKETTLTVAGLKEILAQYQDDMPVLATWEGIYTLFRGLNNYNPNNKETSDYVTVENASPWGRGVDDVPCLVFNVDQY